MKVTVYGERAAYCSGREMFSISMWKIILFKAKGIQVLTLLFVDRRNGSSGWERRVVYKCICFGGSPTVAKNTIIGALAGFVLSSGVVIASWLLNDTIRFEEDVERKLGLAVLGSVPYEESEDDTLTKTAEKKKHDNKKKAGRDQ